MSQAKDLLHQHLHPYFDHKRYLEKQPLIYERKTGFGSSVFIATVSGDEKLAYVKFFTGLRHDLVELSLTNTFGLAEYFKNSSYTLLTDWSKLDPENNPSVLPCRNLSDMTTVGDMALDFMDNKGFDFLNYYKHLSNLDHLFNERHLRIAKWTNHSYLTSFRAMAMAKLSGRSDYDRLFQMHRDYLESRGLAGPIIAKFETTFAHLKNLSLN